MNGLVYVVKKYGDPRRIGVGWHTVEDQRSLGTSTDRERAWNWVGRWTVADSRHALQWLTKLEPQSCAAASASEVTGLAFEGVEECRIDETELLDLMKNLPNGRWIGVREYRASCVRVSYPWGSVLIDWKQNPQVIADGLLWCPKLDLSEIPPPVNELPPEQVAVVQEETRAHDDRTRNRPSDRGENEAHEPRALLLRVRD